MKPGVRSWGGTSRARRRLEDGDTNDTRQAEAVYGGLQLFFDRMEHSWRCA